MRFKVGQKVRVVKPYSGSGFRDGDIGQIVHIERAAYYGEDYYDVVSCEGKNEIARPVFEDEITPITNGDKIRNMNNRELAQALCSESFDMFMYCSLSVCKLCPHKDLSSCFHSNSCIDGVEAWLNSPVEDD